MNLVPLLDAVPQITLYASAAIAAFGLGVTQLVAPKGTLPHRTLGWICGILNPGWAALDAGSAGCFHGPPIVP